MSKIKVILFLIFFGIITAGLISYFYFQSKGDPIKYENTKPEIKDIILKAVASGSIIPRKEIHIKPQVSGVIDQLYVIEGDLVKKGQKLAKIKLIPNEVNINSAKSNVELARIRVKDARKELDREKNLHTTQLSTDHARVNFKTAKAEEVRNRDLFEDGIISQSQWDQFVLDLELKKSIYENAKISSNNNLRQANINLDIRQQEYQAATNNLQLLREGVTKNSGQVSNIIFSTVDGMVLDLPNEEGSSVVERNTFNEGTTIAVVADMTNLIFVGNVDESDVNKLSEGMPLVVTIGAILDTTFRADLEFISPKGLDVDGSIKFEIKAALVDIPDDVFLRAGYSANADVILDKINQVVAVQERDVIYEDGGIAFVDIQTGNQSYEKTQIELGLSDGIYVEVKNGLDTLSVIKKRTDPQAAKAEDN
ncbi:MAG: HlyD family efflux transporter periplasmic adaptor subunit [Saprospiraceae bacterium]